MTLSSKEKKARYRAKNLEKVRALERAAAARYRAKYPEKIKAANDRRPRKGYPNRLSPEEKKRRKKERAKKYWNSEQGIKTRTAWRERNLEAVRERARIRASLNHDRYSQAFKEHLAKDLLLRARSLVRSARNRSKEIGVPFGLTEDRVHKALLCGVCEVTQLPFDLESIKHPRTPWSPSIDRLDPAVGYVDDNIKVVVWMYNLAKNCYTHSDLIKLARAVVATEAS